MDIVMASRRIDRVQRCQRAPLQLFGIGVLKLRDAHVTSYDGPRVECFNLKLLLLVCFESFSLKVLAKAMLKDTPHVLRPQKLFWVSMLLFLFNRWTYKLQLCGRLSSPFFALLSWQQLLVRI